MSMIEPKDLINFLEMIRANRGISITSAALMAGIQRSHYYNMIDHKHGIGIKSFCNLVNSFGVNVSMLHYRSSTSSPLLHRPECAQMMLRMRHQGISETDIAIAFSCQESIVRFILQQFLNAPQENKSEDQFIIRLQV